MIADLDVIAQTERAQFLMHRFHNLAALDAAGHVGLVGYDDDQETGLAQCADCLFCPWEKLELLDSGGRVWLPATHYGAVDGAITIEEHRTPHLMFSMRR